MTPALSSAFALLNQVDSREPGSLTYVVGPGGSAKTSLYEALPSALYGDRANWPDDQIPIIGVSAKAPDRGYFSGVTLVSNLLAQLLDPFRSVSLDLKLIDPGLREDLQRAMALAGGRPLSGVRMWDILIPIAKQVRLRHIMLDEAGLVVLIQQNRIPSDFIEALRAAAMDIGCTVIFFGTFELLTVMDFTAQSNRRTLNIQVERLLNKTAEQRELFLSVADAVAAYEGVPVELVQPHAQWLYEVTYGIVGELVDLFKRAMIYARARELNCVTWTELQDACHLPNALMRMRFEADEIDRAFARGYAMPRPRRPPPTREKTRPGRRKAKRHSGPVHS